MTLNRRRLLAALPFAAVSLAGCSSVNTTRFQRFAQSVYSDLHDVAKKIEAAVQIAATDMSAAVESLLPYIVPVCQIVVTLAGLGNQMISAGVLDGKDPKVQQAITVANGLSANAAIQSAAQTGQAPENPVIVLTGVIQAVSLIMTLTGRRVTPVAAASNA